MYLLLLQTAILLHWQKLKTKGVPQKVSLSFTQEAASRNQVTLLALSSFLLLAKVIPKRLFLNVISSYCKHVMTLPDKQIVLPQSIGQGLSDSELPRW